MYAKRRIQKQPVNLQLVTNVFGQSELGDELTGLCDGANALACDQWHIGDSDQKTKRTKPRSRCHGSMIINDTLADLAGRIVDRISTLRLRALSKPTAKLPSFLYTMHV